MSDDLYTARPQQGVMSRLDGPEMILNPDVQKSMNTCAGRAVQLLDDAAARLLAYAGLAEDLRSSPVADRTPGVLAGANRQVSSLHLLAILFGSVKDNHDAGTEWEDIILQELGIPKNNTVWRPNPPFEGKLTKGGALARGTTPDGDGSDFLLEVKGTISVNNRFQIRCEAEYARLTSRPPWIIKKGTGKVDQSVQEMAEETGGGVAYTTDDGGRPGVAGNRRCAVRGSGMNTYAWYRQAYDAGGMGLRRSAVAAWPAGRSAEDLSARAGAVMDAEAPGGAWPDYRTDDPSASGFVLRLLLGAQFRRLREAVGVTPEQAGYEIRSSRSKISRMETGQVGFKPRDVTDLLTLYGVTDEQERSRFLDLTRRSGRPDWWAEYSGVLPAWFETYLGLESASSAIRSFEIQFVDGLFQTEDYARAVARLGQRAAPDAEIERRVELRVRRQELLARASRPRIWLIMDEAVLRRPIGGPAVMRVQLRRLIEMAGTPGVTVQVVPFARGGHAGAGGSFRILRFRERDLPDMVYAEQLTSAVYLEQRQDVEHYLAVADQLSGEALTPAGTIRFIEQVAAET
jgi:hypothetical protein